MILFYIDPYRIIRLSPPTITLFPSKLCTYSSNSNGAFGFSSFCSNISRLIILLLLSNFYLIPRNIFLVTTTLSSIPFKPCFFLWRRFSFLFLLYKYFMHYCTEIASCNYMKALSTFISCVFFQYLIHFPSFDKHSQHILKILWQWLQLIVISSFFYSLGSIIFLHLHFQLFLVFDLLFALTLPFISSFIVLSYSSFFVTCFDFIFMFTLIFIFLLCIQTEW